MSAWLPLCDPRQVCWLLWALWPWGCRSEQPSLAWHLWAVASEGPKPSMDEALLHSHSVDLKSEPRVAGSRIPHGCFPDPRRLASRCSETDLSGRMWGPQGCLAVGSDFWYLPPNLPLPAPALLPVLEGVLVASFPAPRWNRSFFPACGPCCTEPPLSRPGNC